MHPLRLRPICFTLAATCTLAVSATAHAAILRVDAAATGGGDGTSWATAYNSLQTALGNAVEGDEIWVAAGVYKPTTTPGDREATFQLVSGVALYGGFSGTETALGERDWEANPTVLSGDIDGNDTNTDGNHIAESYTHIQGNNSRTVVTATNVNAATILDGFVVTGGNSDLHGGGMRNDGGHPTIRNLHFSGNRASANGGGMVNLNEGNPSFSNVEFSGGYANNGAGMYNYTGNPSFNSVSFNGNTANIGGGISNHGEATLTSVSFSGNTANREGGGISNYGEATLTNVSFSGNSAEVSGGGIYDSLGDVNIVNSLLWGNRDASGLGTATASIWHVESYEPAISHSLIEGWNPPGAGNLDGTDPDNAPLFVDPPDPADAPTTAGNLRLRPGSPALDSGSNGALPAWVTTDLAGNDRIINGTVDIGAYEGAHFRVPASFAATHASVAPAVAGALPGQPATFTVTPTPGYSPDPQVAGTCPAGSWSGTTYTTDAITADCDVAFDFTPVITLPAIDLPDGGSASVAVDGADCRIAAFRFVAPSATLPPGVQAFPYGLAEFTLVGCEAEGTTEIAITYPDSVEGLVLWKYFSASSEWREFPGAQTSGNTLTFSIQDGGEFDVDPTPGVIRDPSGPALLAAAPAPATPTPVPTLSHWMLAALVTLLGLLTMAAVRKRVT